MVTQNWHFLGKFEKQLSTQQSNKNKYKVKTEFSRAAIIASKSVYKVTGFNRMIFQL